MGDGPAPSRDVPMIRFRHESWQAAGEESLVERAVTGVNTILAEHHSEPLPDDTASELQRIVQRAETAHGSS